MYIEILIYIHKYANQNHDENMEYNYNARFTEHYYPDNHQKLKKVWQKLKHL